LTKDIFNKYDQDHSGRIDRKECWLFIADLFKYYQDSGYSVNMISKETFETVFDGYDVDKSGKLSRLELKKLVDELGVFGEGFVSALHKKDEVKVK
jgi:Ca2+-binding EF-hand superfamily protein